MSCIFFVFELLQGRQCLFEVRSMPGWHCIGTNCVRTNTPIVSVIVIFLWRSDACGLRPPGHPFGRPLSNMFLRNFSSRMNRSWIPKKFFFLHLLEQIGNCSILCPLASSRNGARGVALSLCSSQRREEIHCVLNEFLVLLCSFSQQVPERAVDDADVPV